MTDGRRVEVLTSKGWQSVGDYAPGRATLLAEMLRANGEIVRVQGERPVRPRLLWEVEMGSGAWIGHIDGVELFTIIPAEMTPLMLPKHGSPWAVYPLLPGYNKGPVCTNEIDARQACEELLDQFIWRVGVRTVSTGDHIGSDTQVMSAVPADEVPSVRTAPGGTPVTLLMDAVPDDVEQSGDLLAVLEREQAEWRGRGKRRGREQ